MLSSQLVKGHFSSNNVEAGMKSDGGSQQVLSGPSTRRFRPPSWSSFPGMDTVTHRTNMADRFRPLTRSTVDLASLAWSRGRLCPSAGSVVLIPAWVISCCRMFQLFFCSPPPMRAVLCIFQPPPLESLLSDNMEARRSSEFQGGDAGSSGLYEQRWLFF